MGNHPRLGLYHHMMVSLVLKRFKVLETMLNSCIMLWSNKNFFKSGVKGWWLMCCQVYQLARKISPMTNTLA